MLFFNNPLYKPTYKVLEIKSDIFYVNKPKNLGEIVENLSE